MSKKWNQRDLISHKTIKIAFKWGNNVCVSCLSSLPRISAILYCTNDLKFCISKITDFIFLLLYILQEYKWLCQVKTHFIGTKISHYKTFDLLNCIVEFSQVIVEYNFNITHTNLKDSILILIYLWLILMISDCEQGWKWYERIVERIISEELSILCLIWPPKRMSRCKRFSIKIDCIRHVIYVCTEENIDGMILPTMKVGRPINEV